MKRRFIYFIVVFVSLFIVNLVDYNIVLAQETIIAEEEDSESDYEYQICISGITDEEWIEIEAYIGNDTEVVIPEEIDGKKVREIGYGAFMNCTQITSVVIPDTIDTIGRYAFSGCTALESVSLPSGITSIPEAMFSGCTSLESIDFPETVIECGKWAFLECSALKKVTFSEGLEEIGNGAFRACISLVNIQIPVSVDLIDVEAFMETNILVVEFLNKNVVIGDSAFRTYNSDAEQYETVVTIIGEKDSTAEIFARRNFCLFQSLDGTYKVDYGNVVGCYDTALANYEAAIEFLNEFYIEKYPNLALAPLYGDEKEHKKFIEIATEIITKDVNTDAPIALYNWMNENIHVGVEYGYPIDVYKYKTADCYGNANLLCQLLRSVDIPSVVVTGYTGDTINVMTEKKMRDGKLMGHAWVLAFYDNRWILLDSAMDRIFYSKEDIVKWYYTITVDDYMAICSDLFNPNVAVSLPCYKDGEFFIYGCSDFLDPIGNWGLSILPEGIVKYWYDFGISQWTYLENNEPVQFAFNKSGWITSNGIGVSYLKDNMSILTNSIRTFDGITYWFDQNGNAFNIKDLGNGIELYYGCPVVDVGDSFEISPVIATDIEDVKITWEVSNSSVISIDEDGVLHALSDGRTSVSCDVVNEETGSRGYYVLYLYVRTEPNVSSIEKSEIKLSAESFVYDGTAKQPTVTVTLENEILALGTDYTVSYNNNIEVGTATVTITGIGNYTGTQSKNYIISAASISNATITLENTSYTYDGTEKTPAVTVQADDRTLTEGSDYIVSYTNNIAIGTATVTITGTGNYTGTQSKNYTISAVSISDATVTLENTSYTYDGTEKTPTVVVQASDKILIEGTDYTISYENNTNIGEATVTITGKGNYTGTITKTFIIKLEKGDVFISGKYKFQVKDSSTVAFAGIKSTKTTKVNIPETVKYGGVTFKVTSIADNALKGKTKVTNVTIPSTVTKIGKQAFYGCKNLKTITINSEKLTKIGSNALKGINSKATINVPTNKYSSYKKLLKGKGQGSKVSIVIHAKKGDTFTSENNKYKVTGSSTVEFTGLKSTKKTEVSIPKTVKYGEKTFKVTAIAEKALKGNTKVKKVTVGESVKEIGASAFYGCKNLKTITIKSTKLENVGKNAFKKISSKATIKVPKSKLTSYKKLLKGKGQGSKVKIVKYN